MIRFFLVFFMVLGIAALIPLTKSNTGFTFLDTEAEGGSDDDQTLEIYSYFILVLLFVMMAITFGFSVS